MVSRCKAVVHGVTRGTDGDAPFMESTTVRLLSDQEAMLVLHNEPIAGSAVLLEAILLEEEGHMVQARIRGRVIERQGEEWRVAISPHSRLYSVPCSK